MCSHKPFNKLVNLCYRVRGSSISSEVQQMGKAIITGCLPGTGDLFEWLTDSSKSQVLKICILLVWDAILEPFFGIK